MAQPIRKLNNGVQKFIFRREEEGVFLRNELKNIYPKSRLDFVEYESKKKTVCTKVIISGTNEIDGVYYVKSSSAEHFSIGFKKKHDLLGAGMISCVKSRNGEVPLTFIIVPPFVFNSFLKKNSYMFNGKQTINMFLDFNKENFSFIEVKKHNKRIDISDGIKVLKTDICEDPEEINDIDEIESLVEIKHFSIDPPKNSFFREIEKLTPEEKKKMAYKTLLKGERELLNIIDNYVIPHFTSWLLEAGFSKEEIKEIVSYTVTLENFGKFRKNIQPDVYFEKLGLVIQHNGVDPHSDPMLHKFNKTYTESYDNGNRIVTLNSKEVRVKDIRNKYIVEEDIKEKTGLLPTYITVWSDETMDIFKFEKMKEETIKEIIEKSQASTRNAMFIKKLIRECCPAFDLFIYKSKIDKAGIWKVSKDRFEKEQTYIYEDPYAHPFK